MVSETYKSVHFILHWRQEYNVKENGNFLVKVKSFPNSFYGKATNQYGMAIDSNS